MPPPLRAAPCYRRAPWGRGVLRYGSGVGHNLTLDHHGITGCLSVSTILFPVRFRWLAAGPRAPHGAPRPAHGGPAAGPRRPVRGLRGLPVLRALPGLPGLPGLPEIRVLPGLPGLLDWPHGVSQASRGDRGDRGEPRADGVGLQNLGDHPAITGYHLILEMNDV